MSQSSRLQFCDCWPSSKLLKTSNLELSLGSRQGLNLNKNHRRDGSSSTLTLDSLCLSVRSQGAKVLNLTDPATVAPAVIYHLIEIRIRKRLIVRRSVFRFSIKPKPSMPSYPRLVIRCSELKLIGTSSTGTELSKRWRNPGSQKRSRSTWVLKKWR